MWIILPAGVLQGAASPAPRIVVEGDSLCPRPAAVALELQKLIALGEEGQSQGSARIARIDSVGDGVRLERREPGGDLLLERRLPARASCAAAATAAAVTIAAWQ